MNGQVLTGMETLQLASQDLVDVVDSIGDVFTDLNTFGSELIVNLHLMLQGNCHDSPTGLRPDCREQHCCARGVMCQRN